MCQPVRPIEPVAVRGQIVQPIKPEAVRGRTVRPVQSKAVRDQSIGPMCQPPPELVDLSSCLKHLSTLRRLP